MAKFMYKLLQKIFLEKKPRRLSPKERERLAFEQMARRQLLKLKEKGLAIPVMTL